MTFRRVPLALALSLGLSPGCGAEPSPTPIDGSADTPDAGSPTRCVASSDTPPRPALPGCCTVEVAPEALVPAGDDGRGGFVVPGGQRLLQVGRALPLGGFPMRVVAVPGTRLVIVSDGGLRDEVLAVLDVDTLEVRAREDFLDERGEALFYGLALSADGRSVWASGGGTDRVLSYALDRDTGALTRNAAGDLDLGGGPGVAYVSGLALRADGLLAVALMREGSIALIDTRTGAEVRRLPVEAGALPYDVVFSPDGETLFASLWGASSVVAVSVASGAVSMPIEVGKNPQAMALSPDGATLAVACSDADEVALLDVATRTVASRFFVAGEDAPRGASPSSVRFGSDGRLYVVDALENAVDVVEAQGGTWRRVGRIPTRWHPTDVAVLDDDTVVITQGRHLGTGANTTPGATDITSLMQGSVTVVDGPERDDAQLAAWQDTLAANEDRLAGALTLRCDASCAPDAVRFPIPMPGDAEPSAQIDHVVLIVRENKTYDAYLGDLRDASGAPHGEGDPTLTLIDPALIEDVIPNTRALARTFALGDNHYSHAEQSVQGHVWTTMGRTTDFTERSWLTTWGRGYWAVPPQGTTPVGYPEEGSAFDYLVQNGIRVSNFGEIVGTRAAPLDVRYPGLAYSYAPEVDKAAHVASLVESCRMRPFSYVVMPNDHTQGGRPGAPTPLAMMADNDEGVARLIDAISHSTYWPSTVIFVLWDDPQDGGDHVDNHRSPLLVISPWARRGHVSSVHTSEASVWRTIQLIFGLDDVAHSAEWARAAPLHDLFTATPDFTPFETLPRRWPAETNPADGSMAALLSEDWDWSEPDDQPGLSRLLWQMLRGRPAPWVPLEVEPDDD